jgi:DNA-directed RNA polymerase specialized sigma24 family protein
LQATSRCAPDRLDGRADPATHFTLLVELRDFITVHLPALTDCQQRVIVAVLDGHTCAEIARGEGVTPEAIHRRLAAAIGRLRDAAGAADREKIRDGVSRRRVRPN